MSGRGIARLTVLPKQNTMVKIGIAFSGGGARGIAHIGVIKALRDHGIDPVVVSGTSAGSIVGALLAAGKTPEDMLDFVKDSSILKIIKLEMPSRGLATMSYLRARLAEFIPNDSFSSLRKPLFIAVTNLNTGLCEHLYEGSLFDAVAASSSIPLIFKPVVMNGSQYVDGGLLDNLPLGPLKLYTDFTIGVNVTPIVKIPDTAIKSSVSIAVRCFDVAVSANAQIGAAQCDFLLEPRRVHPFGIFQFNKVTELYDIGYAAAISHMPALLDLLAKKEKTTS